MCKGGCWMLGVGCWVMVVALHITPAFAQYSPAHPSPASGAKSGSKYAIVDGHLHFLNFVQETAGMDAFFKAMDDTASTPNWLSSMPVVKKWTSRGASAYLFG